MQRIPYLKNIDSLIAAIIGYFAIYIFTKYSGIGISPDSIMYASTANNLAEHGSLLTFNGGPLVFFPVFYPFFLSVILFISRVNTVTAAPVINGILFGGVIFLSGYIVSKFRAPSFLYKWLILAAIILSPGLLEIYTYLWSETLFILITLVFILTYRYYLQRHTLKALLIMSITVAISCITRYAGVTVIGTAGLLLLLDNQLAIRKKIVHILIFGFTAISLLVANLVLNYFSTGLSTGTREPSITSFSDNLYYYSTVMCDWMGLSPKSYSYASIIGSILLLALIGILIWKIAKKQLNSTENIVIMFAVVYGLFIVISATFSRYERINSRLLSPMFIPLLIGITSWVPDMLKGMNIKKQILIALPFVIVMLAFEYATYTVDAQRYDDENDYGVPGYTDDDWNKSQFIFFLKTHKNIYKPGVPIYTDADEAVYFFTGASSKLLPHRFFVQTVKQFYGVRHYYLVWFNTLNNTELLGLKDIVKRENLKLLHQLPEGAVYEYDSEK